MLIDFPGLAFFTTYALLVLFWAEIYYQVSFTWIYFGFVPWVFLFSLVHDGIC